MKKTQILILFLCATLLTCAANCARIVIKEHAATQPVDTADMADYDYGIDATTLFQAVESDIIQAETNVEHSQTNSAQPVQQSVMPLEPTDSATDAAYEASTEIITSTPASLSDPASSSEAKSIIVAIDAGHQARGNSDPEPIGPGTSEIKPKVSSGTTGVITNIPEYELTLTVSLKLRDELIHRGYVVYMIRETHDVNISNKERAELATAANADIFVRVHANGDVNNTVNGGMTISPASNTPFIPSLYTSSRLLSHCLLEEILASTGANSKGVWETNTMSGINWATMPVSIVEMGFMTNPQEDQLMQNAEYQQMLVYGIANGIDAYFNN